ncbi:ROK family protein [Chryseobacterium sp. 2TAF14]|uniref:ROK family protein n=1 Tax=Chryseobacterium sp. 2TAF14 TaxID=3233007 RepID=UPI003F910E53
MSVVDLSKQVALGIDIGGTNTKFGLVNHRGEILTKGSISTDQYSTPEAFVDALYEHIQPMIEKHCEGGIEGIGVGAPNANYYRGTIELAPNLPWKGIINFADLMTAKFNSPCKMTNDANAAALGEMMYGDSMLNQFPEEAINSKTVHECALKEDPVAIEVFRYTGQKLGEALANFVMFSSPEAILLFGGVIKAGDFILKPAKLHMERNLLPIFRNKVRLVFSELDEADAAILGASALVWEK